MRYRKKPVVIEAMRWMGDMTPEMERFLGEHATWTHGFLCDDGFWRRSVGGITDPLFIDTLEGCMQADVGDWIIRGVKGEFYPIKDDIFRATYEVADDAAR